MKNCIFAICTFLAIAISTYASDMERQSNTLNCLSKKKDGPRTQLEKNFCKKVYVPGEVINCIEDNIDSVRHKNSCKNFNYGRNIDCLSSGSRGPQDGAEFNMCMQVPVFINCLSSKLDGPQDGADLNVCQNQIRPKL